MEILSEIGYSFDVFILFFLVLLAIAVIRARDLITSTILLGIFSFLMAGQYLLLGAPDVAITEAAVGAGISTILLLLAIFLVGNKEKKPEGNFIVPIMIVVFVGVALVYVTFELPELGARYAPSQIHVSPYYLANGPIETGIPNVVTSVLASYRGYDTFGETVVVLTAAIAVMLLLGRFRKKEED